MRKKIILGIIAFIFLLTPVGYLITKTGWYQNFRQAQFLAAVVSNTQKLDSYQVHLESNYSILGYQMELQSEGEVSQKNATTSHLNYLIKMNGYGVSPMTVELEQYANWDHDTKTLYMNLNRGQWFKETNAPIENYYQYFVDFNHLDYLNEIYKQSTKKEASNDFVILQDTEDQQVISVQLDFLQSEKMIQILIGNFLKISPSIDLTPIYQSAPKVEYTFTIDKLSEIVLTYEISYDEGIKAIIKQIKTQYPFSFAAISDEQLDEMFINLKVQINQINQVEVVEIPNEILNQAVEVNQLNNKN